MPNSIVRSFAKRYKKSTEEVEKLWDKSKEIAKDKGISKSSKYYYIYVTGILKKILK